MKALQEKNISIGKISYEQSDIEEGLVIGASIREGEILAEKIDKVDLVISLGNGTPKKDITEDSEAGSVSDEENTESGSLDDENTDSSETEEDTQVENG